MTTISYNRIKFEHMSFQSHDNMTNANQVLAIVHVTSVIPVPR